MSDQHNGLTLAYLGDAWLELKIRTYLIQKGITSVNSLHTQAIRYTSAVGQEKAARVLQDGMLTEEELALFKRGRNAVSNRKAKNADLATYHQSTGLEALLGYLTITGAEARAIEILNIIIKTVEELPAE